MGGGGGGLKYSSAVCLTSALDYFGLYRTTRFTPGNYTLRTV